MPKHLSSHLMTFLFFAIFLLVGCGQKGPLYLEEKDDTVKEQIIPAPKKNKKITDKEAQKK